MKVDRSALQEARRLLLMLLHDDLHLYPEQVRKDTPNRYNARKNFINSELDNLQGETSDALLSFYIASL